MQTAVEWLINELVELDKLLDGRRKNEDDTVFKLPPDKLYERAKQMEKEQIIGFHKWMLGNDTEQNAEKYFHYSDNDMLNEYLKNKL